MTAIWPWPLCRSMVTLWSGLGDTGELFYCYFALLCIYWPCAATHSAPTCFDSISFLLIVLSASLLCSCLHLNTLPKGDFFYFVSSGLWVACDMVYMSTPLEPTHLYLLVCLGIFILSPKNDFCLLNFIWHVLTVFMFFSLLCMFGPACGQFICKISQAICLTLALCLCV